MTNRNALICVVDDDESVRRAMSRMLRASGFVVQSYESVLSFLTKAPISSASCLLLDIRMPGTSGLELVDYMAKTGMTLPTILITAHEDENLWHGGRSPVLACLQKPVDEKEILDLIELGISKRKSNGGG